MSPGGKKLLYTHISLPLTAIDEFAEKGKTDPLFSELAEALPKNRRAVERGSGKIPAGKRAEAERGAIPRYNLPVLSSSLQKRIY